MKRFLALVLVLALTSMAYAVPAPLLSIYVNGQDVDSLWIAPSDTLTIGVHSDGADGGVNGQYSGALVINAFGTDTGMGSWTSGPVIYNTPPIYITENALTGGPGGVGIISGRAAVFYATSDVIDDYVESGIGFEFEYHADDGGNVTISLFDDIWGIVDTLTISQGGGIPEPMTIALLGFGGLFLRRRK